MNRCGYDVQMTDSQGNTARLDKDFNDTWFEYGLGASIQTGKNNHIYLDVERSAGSDYKKRLAMECRCSMDILKKSFIVFYQVSATLGLVKNIPINRPDFFRTVLFFVGIIFYIIVLYFSL